MQQLVITCHPDGSVETLLKDKVFDTRKLGRRTVERITEIKHFQSELMPEHDQKFYVKWLRGPLAPGTLDDADGHTRMFDSYEDAVEAEIEAVNVLRLQGHSFA